ncbi:hypothetical protein AAFG13_21085 [Bradyrhizobium sp. B124]|uniref:hypothetical protein n=1 Tax=Bradyrhizobium sp. B124 TaxID=3140245 RepID=UPI00318373D8
MTYPVGLSFVGSSSNTAGCAMEADANPRNLKGFLVAFKAMLMSQAAAGRRTGP